MADGQINQNQPTGTIAAEALQQQQSVQTPSDQKPKTDSEQKPVTELQGHKAAMDHWGVTGKTVQHWIKEGMPVSGPNNKRIFKLAECEPWVAEYRRQQAEQDTESKAATKKSDRVSMKNPHRGDPCPNKKCPGKLTSYSQSRTENGKIYFLSCARCNSKPKNNKEVRNFA